MVEFTSTKYKPFEFSVDGKKYKLPNFKSLTTRQIARFRDGADDFLDELAGVKITEKVQDGVLSQVLEAWVEFDEEAGKK